jgi:DNA-binding XRE family transcriptional regulator
MEANTKVSEIVRIYREKLGVIHERQINQEQFAKLLTDGLPNISVTRQTTYNWEQGTREPDMKFLMSLYTYHFGKDTWQLGFAVECIEAMLSEISGTMEFKLPRGTNHNGNK